MLRTSLAVVAVVLAVGGCEKSSGERKASTQVAARVNQEEISIHQVNNVLARAGSIKPEQAKLASRQVLDKLIEQELLVQQAVQKKLDRDPQVMQTIEASKREILARAYLEQLTGSAARPDDAAVKSFYEKNPALFRERRIYNLQELAVSSATPEQAAAVQGQLRDAKSMTDVVGYLKEKNIQFAANSGVKAAEQLPMEILPKLHELKDGQSAVIPSSSGFTLIHIAGSQQRPLDEAAARPFIVQYLTNQRRTELATAEITQLKAKARIEYLGDFSGSPNQADRGASTPPAEAADAAQGSAATGTNAKPGDKALEKGIQGLK